MSENHQAELTVLLQVLTRYTEQAVTVADNLKNVTSAVNKLAEAQERLDATIGNKLSKEITQAVVEALKLTNKDCQNAHSTLSTYLTTLGAHTKDTNDKINWVWKIGQIVTIAGAVLVAIIQAASYLRNFIK